MQNQVPTYSIQGSEIVVSGPVFSAAVLALVCLLLLMLALASVVLYRQPSGKAPGSPRSYKHLPAGQKLGIAAPVAIGTTLSVIGEPMLYAALGLFLSGMFYFSWGMARIVRHPLEWWSCLALVGISAAMILGGASSLLDLAIAHGPNGLRELLQATPTWSVQVLLGFGLVFPIGRMLLAYQLASHCTDFDDVPGTPVELLSSQNAPATRIVETLRNSNPGQSESIALIGEWGSGKSTILEHVIRELRASEGDAAQGEAQPLAFSVSKLNVWREETEPLLHQELYTALLSKRESLYPFKWMTNVPIRLAFAPLWSWIRTAIAGLRVGYRGTSLELSRGLPELPWQNEFERLVRRITQNNSRKTRVVFILDEIDRASPLIAQKMITLTRRALDLPGVTVLMPIVPRHLYFTVFNPLITELPDLRGQIDSTLMRIGETNVASPDDYIREAAEEIALLPASSFPPPWGTRPQLDVDQRNTVSIQSRNATTLGLNRFYLDAIKPDPSSIERYWSDVREKYIAGRTIEIEPLTPEDLLTLLFSVPRFSVVEDLLVNLRTVAGPSGPLDIDKLLQTLRNSTSDMLRNLRGTRFDRQKQLYGMWPTNIRRFQSDLNRNLNRHVLALVTEQDRYARSEESIIELNDLVVRRVMEAIALALTRINLSSTQSG